MKVLTAAQMRDVDRRTIQLGMPGLVLMENAGHRLVEFLAERFSPLSAQRVVVLCGKGNNGGDGLVLARQLHTRFQPKSLEVVLFAEPEQLRGDALENFHMLQVCGCSYTRDITPGMRHATLVIDALLGTGLDGPVEGPALDAVRAINHRFPMARVVAVDIPSGLPSDAADTTGEYARADATVTFTAPKIAHVLPPNCDRIGELRVGQIGSPASLMADDNEFYLSLVEPAQFQHLLAPRDRGAHKGIFGHALIVGGARGKTGAAAMAGMAALRAGAGLVTVACEEPNITLCAPELMTEALPEPDSLAMVANRKQVIAIGPGLGTSSSAASLLERAMHDLSQPLVVDADGLNALAGVSWPRAERLRVLTPHPGEMARLAGTTTGEVSANRLSMARGFAQRQGVVLVLKGQRTLIAFPDGRVMVNPTGSPSMATGGSGDILTGMIAGFLAQFSSEPDAAIAAAVYLHGLAGEIGARSLTEACLTATDLLRFLPEAMNACSVA